MLYLLWWSCCDPLSLIKVTFFEWLAGLVLNQLSYQARAIEMKVFKNILWRAFQKKFCPNSAEYFILFLTSRYCFCFALHWNWWRNRRRRRRRRRSHFCFFDKCSISRFTIGKKIPPRSDFSLPNSLHALKSPSLQIAIYFLFLA